MRLFILVAALALCACTQPAPEPLCCASPEIPQDVQEQIEVQTSADRRTILSSLNARVLGRQCSRISPGPIEDTWLPTDEDVEAVEAPLNRLLAERLTQESINAGPRDYVRQYAGFVIGGRRVVYINGVQEQALALSSNSNFDWRVSAVPICDGGAITFGVEYDPATRQFSNFAFNGGF